MAQSLSTWHRALNALKALKVGMKMPVFFGRNAHINLLLDIHSFICLLFHSASLIRNFPVAGLELGARYQKISGRWQLLGGVIQTSVRHGLSHCGAHYLSSIFPFTDILDLLCSRYWELHTGKCWVFFFFPISGLGISSKPPSLLPLVVCACVILLDIEFFELRDMNSISVSSVADT